MIEIVDYKEINKNSLKAQATVRIPKWGGFLIKRIKIFQKGDTRWISFPAEQYEKEGKTKYFSLVEFDTPSMNEAFRNSFFSTLDEFLKHQSKEEVQSYKQESIPF